MSTPMKGYAVTTPFGKKGKWAAGYHTGDDYSTSGKTGVPVLAAKRGRVVAARGIWGSSYGIHVVIETQTLRGKVRHGYCHLSRSEVRLYQRVKRRQRIGLSGNTGNSTGPHLHYEERVSPFSYYDHRKPVFNKQRWAWRKK